MLKSYEDGEYLRYAASDEAEYIYQKGLGNIQQDG